MRSAQGPTIDLAAAPDRIVVSVRRDLDAAIAPSLPEALDGLAEHDSWLPRPPAGTLA